MDVALLALLVGGPLVVASKGNPSRMVALAVRWALAPFRLFWRVSFVQPAEIKGVVWVLKLWSLIGALALTVVAFVCEPGAAGALALFWTPFALLWGVGKFLPKKGTRPLPKRRRRRR
ncbi:MAG: hypothetical protein ABIH46_07015 [Chloroflexota bacterium]